MAPIPLTFEVLVDRNENPRKCTVQPLSYRSDFKLRRFGGRAVFGRLEADLLLHIDGESLDQMVLGPVQMLAVIDCHWKRCAPIIARIDAPLPRLARIPNGFETAYPRRNMEGKDPEGGLATIEALFIAAAFLGVWDETLLKEYHFAKAFLEMNRAAFVRFGLGPKDKDTSG